MVTIKTYKSPDGLLRFQIIREDSGDMMLGFEGFSWHTHGDLLVGLYGLSQETAVERFVYDLMHNQSIIAIYREGGSISDIRITDDPQTDLLYEVENETIEFRHWDGSQVMGIG